MFSFDSKKFIFCLICSSLTISANEKNLNKNICYNNKNLFPAQSLNKNLDSTNVVADESNITNKDIFNLHGNVEITSPDYYLVADKVKYLKSLRKIDAFDNVKFQDESLFLTGSNIQLSKKEDDYTQVIAIDAEYQIPENNIRGNAKKIIGDKNTKDLQNAVYTKCPVNDNSWFIKSSNIKLDSISNKGQAENVSLYVFNTPVLYTPYHSWVLDGRGSGFLAPDISLYEDDSSSSNKDYSLNIPYYFNLQKDRDLLLSLNYLSSRGSLIKSQYRQLLYDSNHIHSGDFKVVSSFLNKDKISSDHRWEINTDLKYFFEKEQLSKLTVNFDRVSDQNFLKEISFGDTNIDSLNSSINYVYDDFKGFRYSFYSDHEQTVNNGSPTYTRPIELYIRKDNSLDFLHDGLYLNYEFISTKFKNKDNTKIEGNRSHFAPILTKEYSTNSYLFSPSLQILKTLYSLDDGSDFTRNLYKFKFDSQINLERDISIFGKNIMQSLTPKIGYTFVPKENQAHINSFDSSDLSLSYSNLLSGSSFTGLDRISNENNFTLGVETEFLDAENGEIIGSFGIGQKFHFVDEALNSDGTFSPLRNHSNILTNSDIRLGNIDIQNELEIDPDINKIVKSTSSITYQTKLNDFVSLSYYDDTNESLVLNAVQPISDDSHFFMGINRSLTDATFNKITTGLAYESCCWAVRLSFHKDRTGLNDFDKSVNFEFVLKGLTSSSPSLKNKLEEDIPNYLADLDF